MDIIKKQHNWATDLFRQSTYLVGFTHVFEVCQPSHLTVAGHLNLAHRGISLGAVGFASWLSLESAATIADLGPNPGTLSPYDTTTRIPGSVSAGNISDISHHYGETVFDGYEHLDPGAYRLTVQGVSHSDAAPNTDGLIQVQVEAGKGLNVIIIRIEDE